MTLEAAWTSINYRAFRLAAVISVTCFFPVEDDFSGIESGDEEMEDEEEDIEESPVKPKKALAKSGNTAEKVSV